MASLIRRAATASAGTYILGVATFGPWAVGGGAVSGAYDIVQQLGGAPTGTQWVWVAEGAIAQAGLNAIAVLVWPAPFVYILGAVVAGCVRIRHQKQHVPTQ